MLDATHPYTLPELVDIAERSDPETRIAWERAKQRASALGVERSSLLPTLAASASASMNQYSLFFGKFNHEDTALFPTILSLSYTAFDFGARRAKIERAEASLMAEDLSFNDAHRRVVYRVTQGYYRLLEATAQEEAARAALEDAQTVRQAVEARLANGLATLPDALEARATAAQAQYDLASVRGSADIARGALAASLGAAPTAAFQVAGLSNDAPSAATGGAEIAEEPLDAVMARALSQRPDLQSQLQALKAGEADIRRAKSAFFPEIGVTGEWGHSAGFGEQKNYGSSAESTIYPYQAQVKVTWKIFDGGARRAAVEQAQAAREETRAKAALLRDDIENEIWSSYVNLKTAQQRRVAAEALLDSARQSYALASEAFAAGVRTFVDVTTAQRTLARARAAQAVARVQVWSSLADFAFRAGDPIAAAGR